MPGASPDPNLQSVQINMQALSSAYTQVGNNAGKSYKAAVVNMQTGFALPDITASELMLPHNNEL